RERLIDVPLVEMRVAEPADGPAQQVRRAELLGKMDPFLDARDSGSDVPEPHLAVAHDRVQHVDAEQVAEATGDLEPLPGVLDNSLPVAFLLVDDRPVVEIGGLGRQVLNLASEGKALLAELQGLIELAERRERDAEDAAGRRQLAPVAQTL